MKRPNFGSKSCRCVTPPKPFNNSINENLENVQIALIAALQQQRTTTNNNERHLTNTDFSAPCTIGPSGNKQKMTKPRAKDSKQSQKPTAPVNRKRSIPKEKLKPKPSVRKEKPKKTSKRNRKKGANKKQKTSKPKSDDIRNFFSKSNC